MSTEPEHFAKAMSLIKDVLNGKKNLNEVKIWYENFKSLFDNEKLSEAEYKEQFLMGNTDGFAEVCPYLPISGVRSTVEKFYQNRMDYKFIFLPKTIASSAAYIQGYKTGLVAAHLYNSRNKTH